MSPPVDRSGVLAGVLAGVLKNATPTAWGAWQQQRWGCGTPPVHIGLSLFGFVVPAVGGVAPVSMYPGGKAPRPARGPDDEQRRAARCLTD